MRKIVLSIVLCCCGVLFASELGKYLPEDSMGLMVFSAEKIRNVYPEFFASDFSELSGMPETVHFQEGMISISKDGMIAGIISGGPDPFKLETPKGSSFTERVINGHRVYHFAGKNGNVELVDLGKGKILLTENYALLAKKKMGIPADLQNKVQLRGSLGKLMILPPRNFFQEAGQESLVLPPFQELYLETFEGQGKSLNFSGTVSAYDEQGAAQLMLILQQFQLMTMIALNKEDPELSAELMKAIRLSVKQNKVYLEAVFPEPMLRKLQNLAKKSAKKLQNQTMKVQ